MYTKDWIGVGKRLIELRETLKIKSSRQMAIAIDADVSYFSKAEKGNSLSDNYFTALSNKFNVNRNWLESGQGEMFNSVENNKLNDVKAAYNLAKNQSNAKPIASAPQTEILAAEGIIPLADGKFLMNTPLIPIKAYAGYITSWGDDEYISDLPVHPIIVDQAHRGEYKSFEVTGESMDDGTKNSIEDRSIATGRRLDRSHWKNKFHLKKFSRYIIVSLDGILIKEIIDHDTKTGLITCHSLNPDKKQYPDFELSLDRVIQIFNVVQVTKKE